MKFFWKGIFGFLLFISAAAGLPTKVAALTLATAEIRPSRHQLSTSPTPILIIAKTSENVTENSVRLTVSSRWSISSSASNYTVSTAGLPAGVTAWPGINTASSVSGNQITFPSNNLTAGTTYGFFLIGGVTSAPSQSGSDESYGWELATLVGGNVSSLSKVLVPVLSNDQIAVTATVPTTSYYLSANLTKLTTGSTFQQEKEIEYRITYGSNLNYSTSFTLQAEWSLGTSQGASTATVPVLEYVTDSASAAYGDTEPVIDPDNRTITWEIDSLPAATQNQTVTFKVKTTTVSSSVPVTFSVSGRVTEPASTADSSVSSTYSYLAPSPSPSPSPSASPSPTPTPSPSPSPTPTPTPFVTPTPAVSPSPLQTPSPSTVTLEPLKITSVGISEITGSSAGVEVVFSRPVTAQLSYGLGPGTLTQTAFGGSKQVQQNFSLQNLRPGTTYYFRVSSQDNQQRIRSDVFTVKTAYKESDIAWSPERTMISSQGIVLAPSIATRSAQLVVTSGIPFEMTLPISGYQQLASARIQIRQRGKTIDIIPLSAAGGMSVFGRSLAKFPPGKYQIELQWRDIYGGLTTRQMAELKVTSPLLVKSRSGPLERAQVVVRRYDPQTQMYEMLPAPGYLLTNPLVSQVNGQVPLSLPPGRYQLTVSARGFVSQTINVNLDALRNDGFPTITLQPRNWQLGEVLGYYQDGFEWLSTKVDTKVKQYAPSPFLGDVMSWIVLMLLVSMSVFSLRMHTHVSLRHLGKMIWERGIVGRGRKTPSLLVPGSALLSVLDASTHQGLSGAVVAVFDARTGLSVMQTTTNRQGTALLRFLTVDQEYEVQVIATNHGEKRERFTLNKDDQGKKRLIISLSSAADLTPQAWWRTCIWVVREVVAQAFEFLLFLSLVWEIALAYGVGFWKVAPFMAITIVTFLLWLEHRLTSMLWPRKT